MYLLILHGIAMSRECIKHFCLSLNPMLQHIYGRFALLCFFCCRSQLHKYLWQFNAIEKIRKFENFEIEFCFFLAMFSSCFRIAGALTAFGRTKTRNPYLSFSNLLCCFMWQQQNASLCTALPH